MLERLDAETGQALGLRALKLSSAFWPSRVPDATTVGVECLGLRFRNPLGLAAGCDKNGDYIDALGAVGFGFIEVGTVTPRPQSGSPRPRLFRIPSQLAVINRMGFNNKGADCVVQKLRTRRYPGVCGVNIGKNASTPNERAQDDFLMCFRQVYPYADYVTLNLSSPNTPGLRDLQTRAGIDQVAGVLLQERRALRQQSGRNVPVLLKVAPDLDGEVVSEIAGAVRTLGLDGVVATNTTTDMQSVAPWVPPGASGGLSGRPLLGRSISVVREVRTRIGCELPIIGVGGITTGEAATDMLGAGANLLQIYTGFIYRGPALVSEILGAIRGAATPIAPSKGHY